MPALREDALRKPRFAEFFAGIGLVRMGLEQAGWSCAFANDIDPQKLEMYEAQFPDAPEHFLLGDVRQISPEHIPPIDMATASFPCTDLSLAGARRGLAGDQSSALWPFVELLDKLRHTRPALVLLENVVGFLSSHQGADLRSALCALNGLGYEVDMFILDAVRFTPQSRQRLFIVGKYRPESATVRDRRAQYNLFGGEQGPAPSILRPEPIIDFIAHNSDIRWSITDLPEPPAKGKTLPSVLESLPDDAPEWWSTERVDYLLNQMSDRHRSIADKMIASSVAEYGTVFRRVRNGRSMAELRTDGIAGCLRTPKGGSGRQILFKGGSGRAQARLLTPRECARLMGADDFVIRVPVNQALFGFGDAVCVPAIRWIAENYLTPLVASRLEKEAAPLVAA